MPAKTTKPSPEEIELNNERKAWIELEGLNDFVSQYGSGSMPFKIRLYDLYRYLTNPSVYLYNIRKSSQYMTNKHGVVKEVLRAIKTIPTLNHHLAWSSFDDPKKIKKYEQKVYEYLDQIDIKSFVRDGLFECGELGTVVLCNRGKYIQFLDQDKLRIDRQVNGKWVVEYDLVTIRDMKNSSTQDKMLIIQSLPNEVSTKRYLQFLKGEADRYVPLKNCDVISIDGKRNFPWGLPYTMGAWEAILEKEIMDRLERSTMNRLIKQFLVFTATTFDKNKEKPVPVDQIKAQFQNIKRLLEKKDSIYSYHYREDEDAGTALLTMLDYFKLDTLDVNPNTALFKKDVYDKINNDIFMNLGVSPGFIYGGGQGDSFASAQFNTQKLIQYIFSLLEKFERVINEYIQPLLPKDLSCKFYFDRTTFIDSDKRIQNYKDIYQTTGISQYWLEASTGLPYMYALSQANYERKVLNTDDVLNPPQNPFTQSANNQGGRPSIDNPTNQNTLKSQANGGNNLPSPSDG